MRLSGWHCEIAKLIGEGLPNREIKKKIKISDSRLSVLKANPLIQREVEKYKRLHEDKYKKALDEFANGAEKVAKEMVGMVTNPSVQPSTRLAAAKEVLDRASVLSEYTGEKKSDGQELVFEQLLRVTKRTSGEPSDDQELENFDGKQAFEELAEDLQPVEENEIIDIQPESVSFTKQVKENVSLPSVGDNGIQKYTVSPRLKELLRH